MRPRPGLCGACALTPASSVSRRPTIVWRVRTTRGREGPDQHRVAPAIRQQHCSVVGQSSQVTASDLTPSERMLPSVIGGPGGSGMTAGRRLS